MKSIVCAATFIVTFMAGMAAAQQPVITSPAEGYRLGDPGDEQCDSDDLPCYRMEAAGEIAPGLYGFFAVQPLDGAGKRMWVQSRADGPGTAGSVSSIIQFGEADNGAQLSFNIYLLACDDRDVFRNRKIIIGVPKQCVRSEPVKIFRVR